MPTFPSSVVWEVMQHILLPAFLVSVTAGCLMQRWRSAGLAMVFGILAANVQTMPLPWFVWDQELGRLLFVLLLSLASLTSKQHHIWKWTAGVIWIGILSGIVCYHEIAEVGHRIMVVIVSMMTFAALAHLEKQRAGKWVLALLACSGVAMAIVMVFAHSARLSDVGLMWFASAAGVFLSCKMKQGDASAVAGPASVFFPFLLFYGKNSTFSEVPAASFVLIAMAPLVGWIAWQLSLKIKNRWIAPLTWLVMLSGAIVLAMRYESMLLE